MDFLIILIKTILQIFLILKCYQNIFNDCLSVLMGNSKEFIQIYFEKLIKDILGIYKKISIKNIFEKSFL